MATWTTEREHRYVPEGSRPIGLWVFVKRNGRTVGLVPTERCDGSPYPILATTVFSGRWPHPVSGDTFVHPLPAH